MIRPLKNAINACTNLRIVVLCSFHILRIILSSQNTRKLYSGGACSRTSLRFLYIFLPLNAQLCEVEKFYTIQRKLRKLTTSLTLISTFRLFFSNHQEFIDHDCILSKYVVVPMISEEFYLIKYSFASR